MIEKFEELWGTKELLVSFDGANIAIPVNGRTQDDVVFKPWAHVDQNPNHRGLDCVQGIMNLNENGPDDGGLIVLKGSSALYTKLFDDFPEKTHPGGWKDWDRHDHSEEELQWLYDRGCEWEKVCAKPGDLLLWDSVSSTPSPDRLHTEIL